MINNISTTQRVNTKWIIRKTTIECIILIFLIVFSFLNTTTLFISLLLLLALLKQKEIGAIKIINIIALRTIINPGIAIGIDNWQNFKWVILFGCSIYLLFSYFKLQNSDVKKIRAILIIVLLFTFYNIYVALVYSSLPTVAIFKLISYIVVFLGTLIGVGYTYKTFDWIRWLLGMLQLLMICSFFMISIPSISYLLNGFSFQGITNQPNMFGIVAVLFMGLLLSYVQFNKYNKFYLLIVVSITLYMVVLSKSRTAFISFLVFLILYAVFSNIKGIVKIIILSFSISIGIIILMMERNITNFLIEFLYKGQEQNIFYSRMNQIGDLTSNFLKSPWFGNGFAVPVLPFKSYQFSFEFVVEPGNLVIAVLSYSGIIGFLIFLSYIFRIFWVNIRYFKYICFLPISAVLISMGEMVFFSSNNIAIWCYMMLSIYIFTDTHKLVQYQK